jgi:hypothetical protein
MYDKSCHFGMKELMGFLLVGKEMIWGYHRAVVENEK